MNLTELAREIHEQNIIVGWWDDWPVKTDRHETAMMLVISEIAEAMEGHRKNLMDDHLPQYRMFDVEIADALIRLLDLAGAYSVKLPNFYDNDVMIYKGYWLEMSVPEKLYHFICYMTNHPSSQMKSKINQVQNTIAMLIFICTTERIDIFTIIQDKREYNVKRADHKRENRAKDDGKKY